MRRRSTSSLGALHPVLFFMFVYGISLFLAIFVCRTVYFSMHDEMSENAKSEMKSEMAYSGATTSGATATLK